LRTLSKKKEANMLARDLDSMLEGSCDIGLRLRSLLIEFQSLRGFLEEDEMSEKLKTFLAWIMVE